MSLLLAGVLVFATLIVLLPFVLSFNDSRTDASPGAEAAEPPGRRDS